MVFGNKHLSYNISHATLARNLFVRNGAGQTSSDHGEIALCEPGSTGTIEDNTFFAVDTDPEFVYYETNGPGAVLKSGGWSVKNNTIHGHGEVKSMIAPTVIQPPELCTSRFVLNATNVQSSCLFGRCGRSLLSEGFSTTLMAKEQR